MGHIWEGIHDTSVGIAVKIFLFMNSISEMQYYVMGRILGICKLAIFEISYLFRKLMGGINAFFFQAILKFYGCFVNGSQFLIEVQGFPGRFNNITCEQYTSNSGNDSQPKL